MFEYTMKITAIVPVRAGSRRLKNKNMLPFGDSNLLVHKIRQLKDVKGIDRIVVSSDSEEMLQMAKNEDVDIHVRGSLYADDKMKSIGDVVANICSAIDSDIILWAQCTSPMVTANLYDNAIDIYRDVVPLKNDSLMTFEPLKMFLWNEHGPMNYKSGVGQVRSQELETLYRPTFGIMLAPREKMIEWKCYHGSNPYMMLLDKVASVDIDDAADLECAKAYYGSTIMG